MLGIWGTVPSICNFTHRFLCWHSNLGISLIISRFTHFRRRIPLLENLSTDRSNLSRIIYPTNVLKLTATDGPRQKLKFNLKPALVFKSVVKGVSEHILNAFLKFQKKCVCFLNVLLQ